MTHFKNSLDKISHTFFGNVLKVGMGNVISQLIAMAATFVFTRLYLPEDYGIFSYFVSVVGVLSIFSCLRYELAIVTAKKEKEAPLLLFACFILTVIFNGSILIVLSVLSICEMVDVYYLLFPAAAFFSSIFNILTNWQIHKKNFSRISISLISQQGVFAILGMMLYLISPHFMSLIIAKSGGYIGSALTVVKWKIKIPKDIK